MEAYLGAEKLIYAHARPFISLVAHTMTEMDKQNERMEETKAQIGMKQIPSMLTRDKVTIFGTFRFFVNFPC